MRKLQPMFSTFVFCVSIFVAMAEAQTTAFTFQGRLSDSNLAANGIYEMQFSLFDAASGGNQVGIAQGNQSVSVVNGIFTIALDFGAGAFTGPNRFIQIGVRPANSQEPYSTLAPRQAVTSAPYAVKSLYSQNADSADNADNLGGIAAASYVQTNDARLSDERSPTPQSFYYIQNRQSQQPLAHFNISGDGTVGGTLFGNTVSGNVVNAVMYYSIGGNRVFSLTGVDGTFVGRNAGFNSTGGLNSFFGGSAGRENTTGNYNDFFGYAAGWNNTVGHSNSYFGNGSGYSNTSSDYNSFFGRDAGFFTTSGQNAYFGSQAGRLNTTGSQNTFVGYSAGNGNTTGGNNVFIGHTAGDNNITGTRNTLIGSGSNVSSGNLTYATAIGSEATVDSSNTIVLGRNDGSDLVRVPGRLAVNTLGSAGSTLLCRNASNQISSCSSSLRYKTNIADFSSGLDLVKRLRPITFDWKDGGMHDLGLGAEDVAEIEPLLVHYNDKGEVEGVKYDRIGVVLLNAVKEQQAQIERQQKLIAQQQLMIGGLKKLVCRTNSQADECREDK